MVQGYAKIDCLPLAIKSANAASKNVFQVASSETMGGFLFVIVIAVLLASSSDAMTAKLKALKCFVDRPEMGSIEKCYVKAVSRSIGTNNKPIYSPILVSWRNKSGLSET